MTKLHFWQAGGVISFCRFLAKPDDGRIVKYHFAGKDRAETEELLRQGKIVPIYLGTGAIYTVKGIAVPDPIRGQFVL